MARMPGATWKPIPVNHTPGGMGTIYGVTLHIMAGTLEGTDAWFHNSRAQASSHFGTGKAGQLRQWVDSRDKSWAQAEGNPHWISIENEGRGGDKLTDAQLDRCAEVLAWAHKTHGVPLQVTSSPNGRGLGHHAMGGSAWGGHSACPGPKIVAQKPEIVRRAKLIVGGGPDPKPVDLTTMKWPGRALQYTKGKRVIVGDDVEAWQKMLVAAGIRIAVDWYYGPVTAAATQRFQEEHHITVDGIVGPESWKTAQAAMKATKKK